MSEILIDVGIDGLPLFKNSGEQKLWPIIGSFSKEKDLPLFLIGSYAGKGNPKSSCSFLKEFVAEAKLLQNNGVFVGFEKSLKPFKIRLFCSDAPARSFISETMGHSATHGCSKCCQTGTKQRKTGTIYETEIKLLRSDQTFKSRLHRQHHQKEYQNKKTALETLGIGMVTQIPIDPMHLIDLGITKKILLRLISLKSVGYHPQTYFSKSSKIYWLCSI